MALSRDVYGALEDIVGPENISEDPAIVDGYDFQYMAEFLNPQRKRVMPTRFEAVLLPGSTEEVQAIVKAANTHKIRVKPLGTGWIVLNAAIMPNTIQLDLRRMDRILEIDDKNMFAIVEPYVTGAELQAEAMKRGLNCHLIGAGGSCSVIATTWCLLGLSPQGIYMGAGSENGLAVEWVAPTGDVIRTGAMGSGTGWFCGEGPGPSTRGIIRGFFGPSGGFGIVTKAAIKLHPWAGPAEFPLKGKVPSYYADLPRNIRAHTLHFPSEQAFADALYKIYDAQIGYVVHRQFNFYGEDLQAAMVKIFADPTKSLDNLEEMLKKPEVKELTKKMKTAFQVVLVGNSMGDIEWQEKALDQILVETRGEKVAALDDPLMEQFTLLFLLKLPTKNTNFLYSGCFVGTFGPVVSPDFAVPTIETGTELKREHIKRGGMVDDGGNAYMGTMGSVGGGGTLYQEQFFFHDPADPESVRLSWEYIEDAAKVARERNWPPTYSGDLLGALLPSKIQKERAFSDEAEPEKGYWQAKIKRAFDPNDVAGGGYTAYEEEK